jgi:gliding motility-associated lipoprotein GldH
MPTGRQKINPQIQIMNKSRCLNIMLLLILQMVVLAGCNEKVVFEENQRLNNNMWQITDTLIFNHTVNDTTALYNIYLNVRNTTDFTHSNLFVFFESHFPDGRIFKDTVEMILADRFGNWTGKGFGSIRSNSFHFRKDVWFPVQGQYQFMIQHAMREESVRGISDMGIRIEKK